MIQETIRCIEMVEVITEWMEGALDDDQRVTVETHLAVCPECTAYLDQLRTTSALASRAALEEEPAPDDMKFRLLASFRASRPG